MAHSLFDIGIRLKIEVGWALWDLLEEWGFNPVRKRSSHFHHVFEIGRIHIWAYWRPISVDAFEIYTNDYCGPHIPIFASNKVYVNDELVVWDRYQAQKKRHRYRRVPFYFVMPQFLLSKQWPHEREWRWHPGVQLSAGYMKDILIAEKDNIWSRTRRGALRTPKRTGCSGSWRPTQNSEGWASLGRVGDYRKGDDGRIDIDGGNEDDYLEEEVECE